MHQHWCLLEDDRSSGMLLTPITVVDWSTLVEDSLWDFEVFSNAFLVSLVVGDGLANICNNLSDVARYIRSVQCNDNSLDDVLVCSTLLPAWHLAESCTCTKVFGMWNELNGCASFWWPSYYASTETCRTITDASKHWDRLVSLNKLRPKF